MKRLLLTVPLAAALGACATEDLEAFANGLNMVATDLDADINAPCPNGMFRQFAPDTVSVSGYSAYPANPYAQVGYRLNPLGGYSYCDYPIGVGYYDDHHRHGDHDRRRDDRSDDEYTDGYRDGYRDGRRDD